MSACLCNFALCRKQKKNKENKNKIHTYTHHSFVLQWKLGDQKHKHHSFSVLFSILEYERDKHSSFIYPTETVSHCFRLTFLFLKPDTWRELVIGEEGEAKVESVHVSISLHLLLVEKEADLTCGPQPWEHKYSIQRSSQGPTVFKHGAERSGREMPWRRSRAQH